MSTWVMTCPICKRWSCEQWRGEVMTALGKACFYVMNRPQKKAPPKLKRGPSVG